MIDKHKSVTGSVKAITPAPAEWDVIKERFVNPDRFKPEDIRVYKSWLANNWTDRSTEKFSLGILKIFEKTLPGKSVLFNGHEWGPPGSGKWFSAKVTKLTKEEVLKHIGFTPSKAWLKKLDTIEAQEGLHVLECKFYCLASNPAVEALDAAIMSDMSIGFRADGLKAVNDQRGNLLWKEYFANPDGVAEAYEGSFVFLGDQIGAMTKKGLANFNPDSEKGVSFMNLFFKSINLGLTINPEDETSVKMLVEQVEAKIAAMLQETENAKKALTEFKTALGNKDITADQAKALVADAGAYRDAMVEEAVKFGTASGMIKKDEADNRRKELKALPKEQVQMFLNTYKQVWQDRNVNKGILEETDPASKQVSEGEEKVVLTVSEY